MAFEKDQKYRKNIIRKEIGEFLLAPKNNPDDQSEKPRYYMKLTAKEDVLDMLRPGTIIELEAPDEKFKRMLKSDKMSDEKKEEVKVSMTKIPKFVVKRMIAKIELKQS
jgi:hypothetical protein